jgi:hypothetical protein
MLDEVTTMIDTEVLPRYLDSPHFLGLIAVDAQDVRHEVRGMSVWDGDLEGSQEIVSEFRRLVAELAGTSPMTTTYDVLRLVVNRPGET